MTCGRHGLRFDTEPVPSMLVRLGSDSDQVAQAAVDAMKVMIQQSLQVIAMLAVMLYTSWQVTIAILLMAPPLAWMMDRVAKRCRRISHRIQESGAEMMQAADQTPVQPAGSEDLRRPAEWASATPAWRTPT